MKKFMISTEALAYFAITGTIAFIFQSKGAGNLARDFFLVFVAGSILCCFTYTGTWITVAKRNVTVFWKMFVLIDLTASILGILTGCMLPIFLRS
jgi:hypothetical protein